VTGVRIHVVHELHPRLLHSLVDIRQPVDQPFVALAIEGVDRTVDLCEIRGFRR
jgi:hypothetical protein